MANTKEELYVGYDTKNENFSELIPILFILSIVPLIVYLKIVPLEDVAFEFWKGPKENADFFSYYKMVWFLIASFAALAIFGVKVFNNRRRFIKTYFYLPAFSYIICILLSSALSKHKTIALYGFPDRQEGMYVLVSYVIIMILTINLVETEKHIKLLIAALLASAFVISLIGIFQYLGYDLFTSNFGKGLILPAKYDSAKSDLKFLFDKYTIYGTLYHSNYVGSYTAMLFPLSFTLFLLISNRKYKFLFGILTVIIFTTGFGSNSRAGMIGSAVGIIFLFFMIRKFILRHWKYFVASFVVFIIVLFTLNQLSNGKLFNQVSSLVNNAIEIISNSSTAKVVETSDLPLRDVKISDNNISIVTATEVLNIEIDNEQQLSFMDSDSKLMGARAENGTIYLEDEKYKSYVLKLGLFNNLTVLQCTKDNFKLNFAIIDDKFKMLDGKGNPFDIKPIEKIGFEGKESLGSARGYIWSRTLPLILKKPILGYGPDNFAIYFPQNDFIGKYRNYEGRMWEIVDKPHNLYIQIAVSTGIPSLIAFLLLILMYLVSSVKMFFSNEYNDNMSIIGVGIFVAIMGYLGAGFFNDSVISVAPVFWVLLGMGINTNLKLRSTKIDIKTEKKLSRKMDSVY